MSNQAQSIANDLMVGAGALYFLRDDDNNKSLHHLGNCDEFNITTDVTTVEKNSSMNKKRELMARVVTAVAPTATLTLTEYNPYNMALGLFGTENVHNQTETVLSNQPYVIQSVPGVIELMDNNGERYYNVSDVVISLTDPQPAKFYWSNVGSNYSISTTVENNDTIIDTHPVPVAEKVGFVVTSAGTAYTASSDGLTFTDNDATDGGGTITLGIASTGITGITASTNVDIEVVSGTTATGDTAGLEIEVTEGTGSVQTFTAVGGSTTETFTTTNGMTITVNVPTGTGLIANDAVQATEAPNTIGNAGGIFTLDVGTFSGSDDESVYVTVINGTTAAGDLAGLKFSVIEGALGGAQVFTATSGLTETFTLASGATITATVTSNTSLIAEPSMIQAELTAEVLDFKEGTDYIIDEQMLRGGVIQIPANSKIVSGSAVMVSAKVPQADFVTVSGGNAGEISGRLLFVGDPNIGGQYVIEAWKCKVQPDGDFTGLISTDFGSFNLTITFIADYENHPKYPYYKATMIGRADGKTAVAGVYDPNY